MQLFYHEIVFINFSSWFKFNSWILFINHVEWDHICWFIHHVVCDKFSKRELFLSVILQIWTIHSQILLHNCVHVFYLIICFRMKCCWESCFNFKSCAQHFSKNHNKLIFMIRYNHVRCIKQGTDLPDPENLQAYSQCCDCWIFRSYKNLQNCITSLLLIYDAWFCKKICIILSDMCLRKELTHKKTRCTATLACFYIMMTRYFNWFHHQFIK